MDAYGLQCKIQETLQIWASKIHIILHDETIFGNFLKSDNKEWRQKICYKILLLHINIVSSRIHSKKSFSISGNNLYMTSFFPPRESLVSDIPAGDGNFEKLCLQCMRSAPLHFPQRYFFEMRFLVIKVLAFPQSCDAAVNC